MYFSWDNLPFHFLFESWDVSSTLALVFTAISVFCVALFYESLKVWIKALHESFFSLPLVVASSSFDSLVISSIHITDSLNYVRSQRIKNHCLQTFIHVIKVVIGCALMLAVMTYNIYITIALLLGAATGYLIFCHKINTVSNVSHGSSTAISTLTSQTNIATNDSALQPLTEHISVA